MASGCARSTRGVNGSKPSPRSWNSEWFAHVLIVSPFIKILSGKRVPVSLSAWREGDWDSFAGQYFDEWRYDKHVCEPFAIPASWRRFRAIDPSGRSGTTACHWYALDSNGDVWIYRTYSVTGLDYD